MLKSCKYCGRIHESRFDCGKKPKRTKKGSDIDRFRWSQAWQKKRKEINRRDLFLCQACREQGRYKCDDLSVHHIVPLVENFELRLDNDNLITLCDKCHDAAECGAIDRAYLRRLALSDNPSTANGVASLID